MNPNDADLLRRYADERAEAAFAELVRRHVDLVYHAALRQVNGDAHRAEDVTQAVFTLLARKAASLGRHEALAGWLHTATRFTARRVMRTEWRRTTREQEAWAMNELTQDETHVADWERLRPVIDDVLGELNAADRDAVLLRFFAARPLAEIGARLGLTENAARMRVERALEKLRLRLARRGITSTAAALGVVLASQPAGAAPAGLAASVTGTALAGAGASGTTAAWVAFMSTTKFVAGVATLALLLAVGIAVREARASRSADEALAAATRESSALAARARAADARAAVAEQELASLEKTAEEMRRARAAEAAAMRDPTATGQAFLAAHPEAADLTRENARQGATQRFQLLMEQLRLTPAQTEAFYEVMIRADAGLRWNASHQAPVAQFEVGEKFSREQRLQRIREILGEAGFAEFQEFQRNSGARSMVEQVARGLYYSTEPLTAGQTAQLMRIVTQNNPDYRNGGSFNGGNLDWPALVAEARGVLTEKQMAPLAGWKEQATYRRVLREAVSEATQDAKRAAGIPPPW